MAKTTHNRDIAIANFITMTEMYYIIVSKERNFEEEVITWSVFSFLPGRKLCFWWGGSSVENWERISVILEPWGRRFGLWLSEWARDGCSVVVWMRGRVQSAGENLPLSTKQRQKGVRTHVGATRFRGSPPCSQRLTASCLRLWMFSKTNNG